MPKTNFLSRSGRGSYRDGDGEESSPHVLQVYKDCDSDEEVESKNLQGMMFLPAGKGSAQYGIRDKGHISKNAGKSKINTDMVLLSSTDGPNYSPTGGGTGVRRHDSATLLQASHSSPSSSLTPATCKGTKGKPNQKPSKKGSLTDRDTCTETDCKSFGLRVIAAKRPDSCFFCLKSRPQVLVPACIGWLPHPEIVPSDAGSEFIASL
jgi:hypothetical protein